MAICAMASPPPVRWIALAMATANRAVGAAPGATAIEVSLGGIELTADGAALPVAVAGGNFDVSLDGQRLPSAVRLALAPGARLRIRAGADGAWCYVAVGGAHRRAPVLGSNATHTRSALGGIDGRALAAGDVLPVRDVGACESGAAALDGAVARPQRRSDPRDPRAAGRLLLARADRDVLPRALDDLASQRPHGVFPRRRAASRRPTASTSSPTASSWARSRCSATAGRWC